MDLLTDYQRFLAEEKGASDNTISSYLRDLTQYSRWLSSEGLSPESASQADVDRYNKYLLSLGKTVSTVTRSLASLKSFYSYIMGEGLISLNPAKGLVLEKVERKLPQILTGKEVELFLEQPDPRDPKGAVTRLCWNFSMPPGSGSVNLLI